MTSKDITQISVIAAILTILAVLKIPSIIPGLDFQLSAPAALLILAFFGIKKVLFRWAFIKRIITDIWRI